MSAELRIVVLAEPPSGNHYKNFRVVEQWTERKGRRVKIPIPMWYHTDDAKRWWSAVASATGGRSIEGNSIAVHYIVYQGSGSRGDVDNYAKTILDALVKASVLRSDACVTDLHGHKRRDRQRPRTVILVRSDQAQIFGGEEE